MPLAVLTLFLAIMLLSSAIYGGYVGWPWWSILVVAFLMALNRSNMVSALRKKDTVEKFIARTIVGFGIMITVIAIFYGAGMMAARLF